jgi:lipopolysaccharide transport system ATP-binding protein
MPRSEIRKRFDEIVDFSGVEDFIDTPVKRYSGGMYVRLAFAVAAHLEPDILILDEVLAVGDAAFQRKCLGKMGETAKQGRTVLFVSHSMPAVQRLCEKAILLENGDLEAQGDTPSIIATYLHTAAPMRLSWSRTHPPGSPCYFRRIWLGDELRNPLELASTGGSCHVYIDFVLTERCHGLQLTLGLSTDTEEQIFNTAPQDAGIPLPTEPGCYLGCVVLPADLLMPRPYVIRAALWHPHLGVLDGTEALRFSPHETASLANNLPHGRPGLIALKCSWSLSMLTEAVVQRAAK